MNLIGQSKPILNPAYHILADIITKEDVNMFQPDPYDFDMDSEVPSRQFVSHLGGVYKVTHLIGKTSC